MHELLLITALYTVCTLFFTSAVFVLARLLRDNSIMDTTYGLTFIFSTWMLVWYFGLSAQTYALAIIVTLWGLRLTYRIGRKNWGTPEDPRYAVWRNAWIQRGRLYFWIRSYLQINVLQGLIVVAISLPIIISFTVSATIHPILLWLGVGISLFGLTYESLADWQLDRFLAGKRAGTEPTTLLQTGLFYYSRRPNYFGESLVWFGQAIAVSSFNWQLLAFIGPATITYILVRVTGPMLERIFIEKYPEAYGIYMRTTNYMIPGKLRANVANKG